MDKNRGDQKPATVEGDRGKNPGSLRRLKGSLPNPAGKPVSIEEMNEAIREAATGTIKP